MVTATDLYPIEAPDALDQLAAGVRVGTQSAKASWQFWERLRDRSSGTPLVGWQWRSYVAHRADGAWYVYERIHE